MYPASSEDLNKETEKEIYFFTPPFYPLDNFSAHTVHIWDKDFQTSEHAFQWKKFSDIESEIADRIFLAKSPYLVKEISDANKNKQPLDWHDKRVTVMEEILKAKLNQHEDVRDALKRTGKKRIIENSPVDSFWGIGFSQDGKNVLGETWMKIRDNLPL